MHQDLARQQNIEAIMNNFFKHSLAFKQGAPLRLHLSIKEGLLKACQLEAMKA